MTPCSTQPPRPRKPYERPTPFPPHTFGNNLIEGCRIGTGIAGTNDLGNRLSGIYITNSANNVIGGITEASRNVLSGNTQHGLHIGGTNAGPLVDGLFIGAGGSTSEFSLCQRAVPLNSVDLALTKLDATDLLPNTPDQAHSIFLQDRLLGSTELVSINESGTSSPFTQSSFPQISADGRFVTFLSEASDLVPNDLNGEQDVFLRDLISAAAIR